MERYNKEIDGKTVIKPLNKIVVIKDGMATYNPTEEMVLNDGWVEYIEPVVEPTDEELLKQAKEGKIRELMDYDESEDVNDCIIVYGGYELHYWASKDERNDLKSAVKDCIAVGRETYRLDLRDKGLSMELQCELLLQMMAALEVYAIDCYNKTTDHEFAIKELANIEDVEVYDFRVGYPSKCRFEI